MNLTVRLAHDDDCRLLWNWANDGAVRSAAFSSASIPWADHVQWFQAGLASKRRSIYIAETEDARPVGQVRFDTISSSNVEVALSISKEWRGQGLGSAVLRLASEAFRRGSNARIVAHVRPDNRPSLRTFEKAGYRMIGPERIGQHEAIRLELDAETVQPRDAGRE